MRLWLGAAGAGNSVRPRRQFSRARRDWRASFDLSAACGIGRPLNSPVRLLFDGVGI